MLELNQAPDPAKPRVVGWRDNVSVSEDYHEVGSDPDLWGNLQDPMWYVLRDQNPHGCIWLRDSNGTKFRVTRKDAREVTQ